jgi:hypothetical protein
MKYGLVILGIAVVAVLYYLFQSGGSITPSESFSTSLLGPSPMVQQFAQAIALAEGFNVSESIPQRANNPGDITDVGQGFPGDTGQRIGQNIIVFDTAANGWNALYAQVQLMLSGNDPLYPASATLQQVGGVYASDPVNWPANVASVLGVSINTTLGEIAA